MNLLRNFTKLLTRHQRLRWVKLAPLLVISGGLETIAMTLVYLFTKIAGEPGYARGVWPLGQIIDWLPWKSDRAIMVLFGLFLIGFFVFRSLFLIAVTYFENRAVSETHAELSTRMLDAYFAAPYALHLRFTPSELVHDATGAVEWVVSSGMGSSVAIAAELIVGLGLVAFLLVTWPFVTLLTTAVLGTLVLTALRFTKASSRHWGQQRESLYRKALKDVQQGLGGLRELKVLGRERFFHDSYVNAQSSLARTRRRHQTLAAAPRLLIETIFVCCVVLVAALMTLRANDGADIIALLSVFAFAGFRLIPSANRILLHVDTLRSVAPAVERLNNQLALFEIAEPTPRGDGAALSFDQSIVLENVTFSYAGAEKPVLSNVNLTIRRGQSVGVVGPTGAGKSTLIDLILGLLEPTSGRVLVDGVEITRASRAWQRRIGYVPQSAFLFDDSIRCNVALGIANHEIDERRVQQAVRMAQMADFVASLPEGLETRIGERGVRLSGGQRQRIAIARALYHEPELLVFDEATAALDNHTEREVTRAIETLKGAKTLIVIAHRLTTVQRCDFLVFLRDGKVHDVGPFDQLLDQSDEFRNMAAISNAEANRPAAEPPPPA